MVGKKGHLIEYKNNNPEKYNYFLRLNIGNRRLGYYMHGSRILCGLTMHLDENREVNPVVIQDIKDIHKALMQKYGMFQPKAKL
jgi:hypothetical protein